MLMHLYLFSFFIDDLQQQLQQYQYSSIISVYRGQFMSKGEVQQLKNSVGQLISMNSFLSTALDRQVAIIFSGAALYRYNARSIYSDILFSQKYFFL